MRKIESESSMSKCSKPKTAVIVVNKLYDEQFKNIGDQCDQEGGE